MKTYHLLNILLLGLLLTPGAMAEDRLPDFAIGDTRYEGSVSDDGSVVQYLGVPFAAPPVGPLRWREPRPVQLKPGKADAREFGPACFQGPHIVDWYRGVVESFGGDPDVVSAPRVSEDCLYLNIWAPTGPQENGALPVMVYVHGGSNKGGWSYEPNYIGQNLARRNVVVVSVAYRLGPLGFFSHPDLSESNFALLDIVAALRWVRRNIPILGGDPGNVTVFGESAGANNLATLLAVPQAQGLFQRLIHQSGGWAIDGRGTLGQARELGRGLQRAAAPEGTIDDLRGVSPDKLLQLSQHIYSGHFFDPVVDGSSLLQPVGEILARGDFTPIDIMIGTNGEEWLMYLEEGATVAAWLQDNIEPGQHEAVLSSIADVQGESQRLDRLITARQFVCPSMRLAEAIRRRGGSSWFYLFDRQREGEQAATMGAYHGAELPYVFDTHDDWLPTAVADRQLTDLMMDAWVNFARKGDPGQDELGWPAFGLETMQTMVFNVPLGKGMHRDAELCRLLNAPN